MYQAGLASLISCCLLLLVANADAQQPTGKLQQRVEALGQQLSLRYSRNPRLLERERNRLAAVLEAWNRVDQAGAVEENRPLLELWLDQAIQRTMPGRSGRLPAVPDFQIPAPRPEPVTPSAKAPGASEPPLASASSREKSAAVERAERRAPATPEKPAVSAKKAARAAPMVRLFDDPSLKKRSEWSRHPSAAPLEWRDPFVDDDSSVPSPSRGGEGRGRAPTRMFDPDSSVEVDLIELAARRRGFNASLSELQHRLVRPGDTDSVFLFGATRDLAQLIEEKSLLDLYRDGLSSDKQRSLPATRSPEIAKEFLRRLAEERLATSRGEERRRLTRLTGEIARLD